MSRQEQRREQTYLEREHLQAEYSEYRPGMVLMILWAMGVRVSAFDWWRAKREIQTAALYLMGWVGVGVSVWAFLWLVGLVEAVF
jgi:hypothetical protein